MNDDTLIELRALQARAYGPEADIAQDPAALRRLRELEERRRLGRARAGEEHAAAIVDPEPGPAPSPPPASATAPGLPAEPPSPEPADDAPAERPRATRSLSKGVRVMWAMSVVAAAAIAAGVAHGLTKIAPVSTSHGAPQIATLEPVPGVTLPTGWMGAGPSSAVYEFYGLTIFEVSGWAMGPSGGGDECISVLRTDQLPQEDVDAVSSYSFSGAVYSGCRVGSFPATVNIDVDTESPREVRDRFPDGALQFVMDGDRIGVFLDDGAS